MIGHQILLGSNDSTSRVLPINKEKDRYRIQFESEFEFKPAQLVTIIDRVAKETGLARSFIVEVEDCESGELVYSFKMDDSAKSDIIPCQGRVQPKSCYKIWFTLLETSSSNEAMLTTFSEPITGLTDGPIKLSYIIALAMFSILALILFIIWKRKRKFAIDPNLIPLGTYQFDKRNTELIIEHQRIDLTGKEADLLLLLYNEVNTTVEREVLLNMVWGDEGDYVGRTLDVFISKLRKKLEFDSKVKIVNIRGVGYKLVLDV
ncbi:MAG: winged helix-turn-helix domain-containing protein [Maribacter sp.]|nr:winged helix-turn-helix domain-containing protein [Maribacter sp.]